MRIPPALSLIVMQLAAGAAAAETALPRLQDAIIVAKGSTITISRLPIRTPAGTIYRDVTIELHADAQGRVTLVTDGAGRAVAAGMPEAGATQVALRSVPSGAAPRPADAHAVELPQRPSPPIVMQHFTAGTYTAPDGALIRLQNRGMDLVHHLPVWSITAEGGGVLSTATFYSGPPFLNPRAARLKRADITSADYAYGSVDDGGTGRFETGALIGVAQSGTTLRVVSFSRNCCSDRPEPTSELIFTYVGR